MTRGRIGVVLALSVMAAPALRAQSPARQPQHDHMAPLAKYLMADRSAEIALARSAAPDSISNAAEVMVLGLQGYEIAVRGTNQFVCLVERSWDGAPRFWDPTVRGPDCLNGPAARYYLPIVFMRTRLALAGESQAQIEKALGAARAARRLPQIGVGAMSYMMSKHQSLPGGNWHPHVMFFVPLAMGKAWGAHLPGSPILANDDVPDRLTIYMMLVPRWSDGTADANTGR
jgi:hypothetical protein